MLKYAYNKILNKIFLKEGMLVGGIILNALATTLGTLIVLAAMAIIGESFCVLMSTKQVDLAKRMLVRIMLMFGLTIVGLLISSCGADPHQWATIEKAFVSIIAKPLAIQFSVVVIALVAIIRGLSAIISTKMSAKKEGN